MVSPKLKYLPLTTLLDLKIFIIIYLLILAPEIQFGSMGLAILLTNLPTLAIFMKLTLVKIGLVNDGPVLVTTVGLLLLKTDPTGNMVTPVPKLLIFKPIILIPDLLLTVLLEKFDLVFLLVTVVYLRCSKKAPIMAPSLYLH